MAACFVWGCLWRCQKLVHTFSISSQCKSRLQRDSSERTTSPRLTCGCILVEVGGRLGVSMGHFVMSIWPELHHRIVRLQRNLGQRTVGPSLICEWILVEIGGCLGVNRVSLFHAAGTFSLQVPFVSRRFGTKLNMSVNVCKHNCSQCIPMLGHFQI